MAWRQTNVHEPFLNSCTKTHRTFHLSSPSVSWAPRWAGDFESYPVGQRDMLACFFACHYVYDLGKVTHYGTPLRQQTETCLSRVVVILRPVKPNRTRQLDIKLTNAHTYIHKNFLYSLCMFMITPGHNWAARLPACLTRDIV